MKKLREMPIARLRELFIYEPDTGYVRRRIDRPNSTAGTIVGTKFSTGHLNVSVDGIILGVHRIAWALFHNKNPEFQIDHINGDGSDNMICNLRLATSAQNNRNRRVSSRSRTGVKNVFWVTKSANWRVAIGHKGNYHITHFNDFKRACMAADYMRAWLHAEFANDGTKSVAEA